MKKEFLTILFCMQSCFAFSIKDEPQISQNKIVFSTDIESPSSVTKKEILKCDPKLDGVYEFDEDGKLSFYPKHLIMGKDYKCSYDGGEIDFKTPGFEIENFRRISSNSLLIEFNDFVNLDDLKKNIRVYEKDNLSKNDVKFQIQTKNNKIFLIKANSNKNLNIEIKKELPSSFKSTLSKDFSYDFNNDKDYKDYKTATNLQKDDIYVVGKSFDDGMLGARVYLLNYINANAKYIKIDGISNFKISDVDYCYDDEIDKINEEQDKNYTYYFDIKSKDIKPNSSYKVSFLKGFGDSDSMNREIKTYDFATKNIKPFLAFSDDKLYFSKNSNITFKSANIDNVKIILSKISDDNLRYFLNFLNYNTGNDILKMIQEVAVKSFDLSSKLNEINENEIKFDFNGYKDGIYDISVYYHDKTSKDNELKSVHKIAYLSDISALVSVNKDEISVLTTRLSTAEILPDCEVIVYSDKNEVLAKQNSGSNGIVSFKKKDIADKNPMSVVVKKGGEQSFIILEDKNRILNGNLGKDKDDKNALLYFASNIIRPKEDIKGAIVVKNNNFSSMANLPVKIKIFDPKSNLVVNKNLKTDNFGLIEFEYPMSDATGFYNMEVIFEGKVIASKTFSVENFVPNRVKNEILSSKDEFNKDENASIKLISNYIFGLPASNLKASVDVKYFDKDLQLAKYSEYSFKNSLLENDYSKMNETYNFMLDNNGKKEIFLHPDFSQKVSNAYEAKLNFSVVDNAKTISAYKDFTIFAYKNILGLSSSLNFTEQGSDVKFKTILLDSKNKTEANSTITIEVYKRTYNYVYEKDSVNEEEELNLIDSFEVDANKEFSYAFKDGGDFIVVASDLLNGASASVNIDVNGYSFDSKQDIKNKTKVDIKTDKASYKPNEKLKLNINSLISKGKALIILSSDDIKTQKVVNVDSNEFASEIEIPQDFNGGYVSVVIFKEAKASNEPLRAYGYKAIKLNKDEHKIPLNLEFKKDVKNNEEVSIKIKSKPNAKAVVFLLDEGVAAISNQKKLNAFLAFDKLPKFGLEFYDIFDSLSLYTSNAKPLSFGGDANLMMAARKNLSPVKTKNIKTFQMKKSVILDANGEGEIKFKTPNNFNSKIRISVFVVDKDGIGSSNDEMVVKDDVIIKNSKISYLIKGDEVNYPLTLINSTKDSKDVKLDILSSKNIDVNFSKNSFALKPLESINLTLKIKAKDIGDADLNITINDKNQTYTNNSNLTVISPYPLDFFTETNYIKPLGWNIYQAVAKSNLATLDISSSPAVILSPIYKYFNDFYYDNSEQLASKLLVKLYEFKQNKNNKTKDEIFSLSRSILQRLNDDGTFKYYSAYKDIDNKENKKMISFSAFVADAILQADKELKILSNNQKNLIISGLNNSTYHYMSDYVYANYVVCKYSKLALSNVNKIYDDYVDSIGGADAINGAPLINSYRLHTLFRLAYILKANSLEKEFNKVMDDIYSLANFRIHENPDYIDFTIEELAGVIELYNEIFDGKKDENNIMEFCMQEVLEYGDILNLSARNKASLVRALSKNGNLDKKSSFNLTINKDKFTNLKTPFKKVLNLKADEVLNLELNNTSKDNIYYSLYGYAYTKLDKKHQKVSKKELKDYEKQAKKDNGFSTLGIYREFVNQKGNKIDLNSLKVGDVVYSKNSIYTFGIDSVLIDEGVSSCFEIINERLEPMDSFNDASSPSQKEYLNERVLSAFDTSYTNTLNFYTKFRVIMSGKCKLPAVKVINSKYEVQNDYDLSQEEFDIKE